jgi:DNA-binding winged helix-turn-helix (wHTH) protein
MRGVLRVVGADLPASVGFGRFRVLPHRREMIADGKPIKLGGRAFDILMALIEARGAVVTKDVLMGRVWPGRVIEENNLQSHITALPAVLGPDRDLIRTVSGRGYQFTGETAAFPATRLRHALASRCQVRSAGSAPGVSRVVQRLCRKAATFVHTTSRVTET